MCSGSLAHGFVEALGQEGEVRLCADDVGMAIYNMCALIRVAAVYALFLAALGSNLKHSKCILTPHGAIL